MSKAALQALKEARKKGGRLSQWKPEDSEIYDSVTEDQYLSIVGTRLKDDFIDNDDGSGYMDNGEEYWDDKSEQESEDEDAFEGEDEALKLARKKKRQREKTQGLKNTGRTKNKPMAKPTFSDYTRSTTSTYRPMPNAMQEDDFMTSLLSSVSAVEDGSASRKRKSSPAIPSSDGYQELSSEDSFFSSSRKRYGANSDDEPPSWDIKRVAVGKKPRVSDATVVPGKMDVDADVDQDNNSIQWGNSMDIGVKPEIDSDDDGDIKIRNFKSSTNTIRLKASVTSRKVINTAAVKSIPKHKPPQPTVIKKEPEFENGTKPTLSRIGARPKADTKHWSAIQESLVATATQSVEEIETVNAPIGSVKPENVLEENGSLRFFWIDFHEEKGVIHLIGKVLDRHSGKYISCCVAVTNIERKLYVKPRPKRYSGDHETDLDVSEDDVMDEFEHIRSQTGIDGCKYRFVKRKYAFEDPTVEKGEGDWMEVIYGFDQPELRVKSGATFSHVFGAFTSPFEMFVVPQKIMGPSWLEIGSLSLAEQASSWCKIEFNVHNPENINPFSETDPTAPKDTPPLTIMSLSMRSIVNHRESKTEILSISMRTWEGYCIEDPTPPDRLKSQINTFVRPIEKYPQGLQEQFKNDKSIQFLKNERSLLNATLATIHRIDADVIVSHGFIGNNFESMMHRLREVNGDQWSRLGRIRKRKIVPHVKASQNNAKLIAGRLVVDLSSDAAKGMITSTTWSLTEMTGTHLNIEREEIDPEDTVSYFDHTAPTPDRLIKFIRLCEVDAYFQMAIACRVQILPLTKQLTNLAGNSWNMTLNGGRAVRNEFILLHEFHRLEYVCPDKQPFKFKKFIEDDEDDGENVIAKGQKGKAKYTGGLVFEPKRGLWDKYILVMDFNSLYPSIIQEYNIDFTTIVRDEDEEEDEKIPDIPSPEVAQGVLPRIIATLVNRRRQVKGLMKDKSATPAKLLQYDIKQQALKLTANSMYGCLGFAGSRFSSRPLAALTTFKGREILTHTRELAESLQLDVIYGDTDSVFVNSNVTSYSEAIKIANDFKKLVNERYKLLEIDLDAVFERILLLNKKKYAAVKIDEAEEKITEVKGLDMKRREFSKISKDVSSAVLKEILSGKATETVVEKIHELLISLSECVRNGEIPVEDYIMFKRLSKNPEDYPDKKALPHVAVALRMKQRGVVVRAHDVIPYIMCLDESGKGGKTASGERAHHPDELRRQGSELRIDYEFYLDQQILQPVLRLCETIEGTERARLAECLGLDPSRYTSAGTVEAQEKEFFTFHSQITDKERFRDADLFELRCPECGEISSFVGLNCEISEQSNVRSNGICCNSCQTPVCAASLQLQLEYQIRSHICKYYLGWLVCDGEGCGNRTRTMCVYGKRCLGFMKEGCRGIMRLEYPDVKLYNQLLYYRSLFDSERILDSVRGSQRFGKLYLQCDHAKSLQTRFVLCLLQIKNYF
ncbi:uncharacterized protein L203_104042 [Cryptococcus depauperatus CBS 7841]|uniref:DNA polymerase n=1 Tax=Cryptococcus depauperatus CBS 7841 TaxID=1295531 RepID=A0AAJ8M265_9TREE